VSHFISSVSHIILSGLGLHGPWSVAFGLVAWAVAYVFLTRVITPDSISDLMTLIVAVLPFFSFCFALLIALTSLLLTPRHVAQGIIFLVLIAAPAGVATFFQCRDPEIWDALKKNAKGPKAARSTIPSIGWGLFGAILVFASEFGLIFGGWQFLQGSRTAGIVWAGAGAAFVVLGLVPGGRKTPNPLRKGVVALQPDVQDRSIGIIHRLLAPPSADGVVERQPPNLKTLWESVRKRLTNRSDDAGRLPVLLAAGDHRRPG